MTITDIDLSSLSISEGTSGRLVGSFSSISTIRFGEDNTVGTGAAEINEADGVYGSFTVSGGFVTPNQALTAGQFTIGSTDISIEPDTFACATDAEVAAIEPHTLSTAIRPEYTVLLRKQCVLTSTTTRLFGGGFPRPNPLPMYGKVHVEGELVNGEPVSVIEKWRAAILSSQAPDAGFYLKNIYAEALDANDDVTWNLVNRVNDCTMSIDNLVFRGNAYDGYGDYGAKIDYSGLTGSFVVGDFLDSPDFGGVVANRRRIVGVFDNGDGTGTLEVFDGSRDNQNVNTLRDIELGNAMTGVSSGAAAVCAATGYSLTPTNPSVINITGNPTCKHFILKNSRVYNAANPITIRATDSIVMENNLVDGFVSDSYTIVPNGVNQGDANPSLVFRGNDAIRSITKSTDLGNPHSDFLQIINSGDYQWDNVTIEFNRFLTGDTRGECQGIFIQGATRYEDILIRGNAMASWGTGNMLLCPGLRCVAYNNSVIQVLNPDGSAREFANNPTIGIEQNANAQFNVAHSASITEPIFDEFNYFSRINGNTATGFTNDDIFAGKATGGKFNILTFEELEEALQPGPLVDARAGAYGSVVDWDTRTMTTAHVDFEPDPPAFGEADWSTGPLAAGESIRITTVNIPPTWAAFTADVQYRIDGGAPVSISSTPTTITVSGLTDGQEYSVEVRVSTEFGVSAWSTAKLVTPSFTDDIFLVGSRVHTGFAFAGSNAFSLTGLQGGEGATPEEGDLVVVAASLPSNTSRALDIDTAGYTSTGQIHVNSTNDVNYNIAYKVMGPTPDTEVFISDNGVTTDPRIIIVYVLRNVDPINPLDVALVVNEDTNSTIPNPPAITPVTEGAKLLVIGTNSYADTMSEMSAGYLTDVVSQAMSDTQPRKNNLLIGMIDWTSGAYDPAPFTLTPPRDETVDSAAAFTLALRKKSSVTVTMLMGQSELEYLVNTDVAYRAIPQPTPGDGNVIIFTQAGNDNPPVRTVVNATTVGAGQVNPTVAAWSALFDYVAPGSTFVVGDGCVPGTSTYTLVDDSVTSRKFSDFAAVSNAMEAEFGKVDQLLECWYNSNAAIISTFKESLWPFYFGRTFDDQPFTLGSTNPDATNTTAVFDHCLWDAATTPDVKGRGLYRRGTTTWSVLTPMPFNDGPVAPDPELGFFSEGSLRNSEPTRQFMINLADNPLAQSVAIAVGPSAHISNFNGGIHPITADPDGQILLGWPFAIAMLRRSGIAIDEPTIVEVSGPTNGTYADVEVDLPNGGTLTTLRQFRGESLPVANSPHQQVVTGFELTRGTRRPVFREDEVTYPATHRGTITIVDSGTGTVPNRRGIVRITPEQPFTNGNSLSYLRGQATAVLLETRDIDNKLYLDQLIEHVPALYDAGALYPMEGVSVRPLQQEIEVNVPFNFTAQSTSFNGTTSRLSSSSLDISPKGNSFLFSAWFYLPTTWASSLAFFNVRIASGNEIAKITTTGSNRLVFVASGVGNYATPTNTFGADQWHHLMWHVNANAGADTRHQILVDGATLLNGSDASAAVLALSTDNIGRMALGYDNSANYTEMSLGHVWFDTGVGLFDLSDQNNVDLFAGNAPISLGANGELPFGTPPIFYADGGADMANRGTGGALTSVDLTVGDTPILL